MSYYLDQLEGSDDDDYYSGEEEGEFDQDEDEEVIHDQQEEDVEDDEEERAANIEQQKASLSIQTLSNKKQQNKQKNNKSAKTSSSTTTKKKEQETNVMSMTEEELEYYQNLKLYGISGPKNNNKKQAQIIEEIKFKLDVLQSSKMFFESVRPISLTIISGNPKYEEQKRYILSHSWEAKKGKNYNNDDALLEGEVVAPKFVFQDVSSSKIGEYVRNLMNRTDHMSTLSADERSLFIYGGRTGTTLHDDLIRYDFLTGKMVVFKNLGFVSHCNGAKVQVPSPSISNSEMVSCGGRVYIFGGSYNFPNSLDSALTITIFGYWWGQRPATAWTNNEMVILCMDLVIGNTCGYLGTEVPHPNSTAATERAHPTRSATSDIPTARSHFSLVKMVKGSNLVEAILFGGKKNNVFDDMYIFTFHDTGRTYDVKQIKKPPSSNKSGPVTWPSPRYGHSACLVSNLMFVYGGCNVKGKILNDLYMYDISTQKWTEIICDSMLPPPLFKHQAFSVNNQSIYIYGGQSTQENTNTAPTVSSSLFRFDITDKKWNIIEIITEEADDIQNNKAVPCVGHQTQIINGKLLRVGGLSNNVGDPFVKLLNLNDPGRPIPLCSYLSNKRSDGFLCDVVFRVRDVLGQEVDSLSYVLAHKAIIKARCSSLHKKILESTETMSTSRLSGTFNDEMSEITLVDIEEVDTTVFEQYINFLYTGTLELKSSKEVNSFVEFVKTMSPDVHYPAITKICTSEEQKDLEVTKLVLSQIHKDFSTLINDHSYSDLIVVLDQPDTVAQHVGGPTEEIFEEEPFEIPETNFETNDSTVDIEHEIMSPLTKNTVPSGGIAVHRLIMSRSPFFSRMFVTSGMMESKEKIVHLTDYSTEVMLEVLSYLYTDTIRLSPRNCLGILVYCIMLDLVDMASVCRRMVVSLLEDSIVWSVIDIAMLYNDKTLESECEHYILNNFEKLRGSSGFLNLPELTRIKIKQLHEKKAEKKSRK